MKTPNSLQAARSIRASEETNQKMHAVLLPGGKTGVYIQQIRHMRSTDTNGNNVLKLIWCGDKKLPPYLMKMSCADGLRRALLSAFRWASLSGPLCRSLWNKQTTSWGNEEQIQTASFTWTNKTLSTTASHLFPWVGVHGDLWLVLIFTGQESLAHKLSVSAGLS